jgi:hypothetical protein
VNTTTDGIVKTTKSDGTLSFGTLVSSDIPDNAANTSGNAATATTTTGNAATATGLNTTTDGIVKTTNSDGTLSIGAIALNELSDAFYNTSADNLVVGHIPVNITSGTYNNAFGSGALSNVTTGNGNTAMGHKTMEQLLVGAENTGFGQGALNSLTSGGNNTAVGVHAGSGNQTGRYNTSVGQEALNGTGNNSSNTAVGFRAGNGITTGSDNVFIGKNAGYTIDDGSSNVVIGDDADVSATNSSNQIVIGKGATGVGDNIAVIGNASTEKVYMSEDAGAVVYTAGIVSSSTLAGTSGVETVVEILPTINQTSTAGYTGLKLNVTETGVGSGDKKLIDLQVNGISKFSVNNLGAIDVTADVNLGANKLTGVANPTANQDAATKAYVDTEVTNGTATNVSGVVAIANGGTGAAAALAARNNLGLYSGIHIWVNDSLGAITSTNTIDLSGVMNLTTSSAVTAVFRNDAGVNWVQHVLVNDGNDKITIQLYTTAAAGDSISYIIIN